MSGYDLMKLSTRKPISRPCAIVVVFSVTRDIISNIVERSLSLVIGGSKSLSALSSAQSESYIMIVHCRDSSIDG